MAGMEPGFSAPAIKTLWLLFQAVAHSVLSISATGVRLSQGSRFQAPSTVERLLPVGNAHLRFATPLLPAVVLPQTVFAKVADFGCSV